MPEKATKNKNIYSILRRLLSNATFEKTFERVGKSISTPCRVDIPPMIQNSIIGKVKGVFKVILFRSNKTTQTNIVIKTMKSSNRTYAQVFWTSTNGSLG